VTGRSGAPVDAGEAAVRLDDAAVERDGTTVWSGGSLAVPAGAIVAVIGPNGSGKTTLLQVLLGVLPVAAGRVEVLGGPPRRGDARIGYVPQRWADTAGAAIRARDLVALGRVGSRWGVAPPGRDDRDAVDRALTAVGADSYARRRMGRLSGGQQQRVAIAQALVADPELLLLDEPLANLDVRHQHEIVQLLGRIADDRPVTILVVAHDLNPLLPVLNGAIYLLDGHPHYDAIGEVVDEDLLSHLYGTRVSVVHTAQGDLFTRSS
jgi:zinc/manganese transport system ATP-binding protein